MKTVIGGVVVILILAFVGHGYWNRGLKNQVDDTFVNINAVWAVQGPFKNGAQSAQAMRYATRAVGGPDSFYNKLDKHAAAYDAHPDRWEGIRRGCLQFAKGDKFKAGLEAARKLGAVVDPNYVSSTALRD